MMIGMKNGGEFDSGNNNSLGKLKLCTILPAISSFHARQLIRHGHIIGNATGMTEERLRFQPRRISFLFSGNYH